LDRGNMGMDRKMISAASSIADRLLKTWNSSLSLGETAELTEYMQEAKENRLFMMSQPDGIYHGSRYFFNNDDMIRKTPDYYFMINMASSRVDGLESSCMGAANFNFYSCDGVTLLQRQGNEYAKAIGAFNLTSWPGVTTRQTPETLKPIVNWSGYCSCYNFAAGATSGSDFAAGFIYQKFNAQMKPGRKVNLVDLNPSIFDVIAYNSWFMFGNTVLALGAGITNQKPEFAGDIWTTVDQTSLAADSKTVSASGIDWQINNGFAYAILPQYTVGTPILKKETRMSKWKELSKENKGDEYNIDVFEMAINHGHDVKDATYAYVIDCDGKTDKPMPRILSNTTALQAAGSPSGNSVGAVFFDEKAELKTDKGNFKVSAPCALLIEYDDGSGLAKITVTDAKMDIKLSQITVATPFVGNVAVNIKLPVEPFRGKPASAVISYRK
ncbi:MAG: polysaccharide lyase family 8 super-sandwich domain-containing protein, partial [Lentisphaerota bacterium]